MMHEFIHEGKVYRLKSQLDLDSPNEEPILFRDLNSAQAFFQSVSKNRLACEDLLDAAKWLGISNPGAYNNKISQTPQAVLEQLCLKIWAGDLLLVEIKPPKPDLQFEECCVESLRQIDLAIGNSKIAATFLCIAQVHDIFASHSRLPGLLSTLSSACNFKNTRWKDLSDSMLSINLITRTTICKIAELEYHKHQVVQNNIELGKYWKRIYDASNN